MVKLTETDNLFFEEYKRLDKLCSDIYNDKYGISTYIKDMEDNDYIGQKAVKSWHRVYKSLKHIRWLRSQIAHEVNTTGICTYDDIEFIQKFYNQIFASTDPISQLERFGKYNQTSSFKRSVQDIEYRNYYNEKTFNVDHADIHISTKSENKKGSKEKIIATLVIITIMIMFIFISKYVLH